jgi:hypothetical protein
MGGIAGHMSHLYDNPNLTFSKMKEVMEAVAEAELETEEKVDGQNLFLSYSIPEGKAKGARNKGNLRTGGLDAVGLATKFAGRGNLEKTFVEGFAAFERAVETLGKDEKLAIFGPNTDVWYNAEIMDPESRNVINYDSKTLKIHDRGHFKFDKSSGEKSTEDVSANLAVLDSRLESLQNAISKDKFSLVRSAIIQLEKMEDKEPLKEAYSALDRTMSEAGVSESDKVGQYIFNRLRQGIDVEFSDELLEEVIKYILKLPGNIGLRELKKRMKPEEVRELVGIIDNKALLLKQAINPLEMIVHNFSVEVLKSVESMFIVDTGAEVKRQRAELADAVNQITDTGSEDPQSMDVLQQQLNKIKDISRLTTPAEGIVFDYDGHMYKLTGNFAPLNQILGLFKYAGKEKRLTTEALAAGGQVLTEKEGKRVALLPGGFKPPHAGHYGLAKMLSSEPGIDEVIVIIGKNPRFSEVEPKITITAEQSKNLWDIYTRNDENIKVKIQEGKTPVADVYDMLADKNYFSEGDTVVLGKSDKDVGDTRYARAQSYAEMHNPGVGVEEMVFPVIGGETMGGTALRNMIASGQEKRFMSKLPKHLNKSDLEAAWDSVSPAPIESLNNFIDDKIEEMSAMSAGSVEGSVGAFGQGRPNRYNPYRKTKKPKVKRAKRQRRR